MVDDRVRRAMPYVLNVLLPMLIGGLIYVLWRDTSLVMFGWFDVLGLDSFIEEARRSAEGERPSNSVLYVLPDLCWVYAGTFLFARLWRGVSSWPARLWIASVPFFSIGSELGQLVGLIPGTFDPLDLIGCTAAAGAGFLLGRRGPNRESGEEAPSSPIAAP